MVFQNQPFKAVDLAERRKGLLAGLRAAVKELKRPGHVKPQWDQLVLVGHSVGGNMAAQLAADTGKQRLLRPKAAFAGCSRAPRTRSASGCCAVSPRPG